MMLAVLVLSACAPPADLDPSLLEVDWIGDFESDHTPRSDGVVVLSLEWEEEGLLVGSYRFETVHPLWEGASAVYSVEGRIEGSDLVLTTTLEDADPLPRNGFWCQGELSLGLAAYGDDALVGGWVGRDCVSSGSYDFAIWD